MMKKLTLKNSIIKKAIILAGGNATRLYPTTFGISKHCIPVHDKPMIYYPISTLIKAGIKDFIIVSNPPFLDNYKKLLKTGKHLGVRFKFLPQHRPTGLPDVFKICKNYIKNEPILLNLGDHFFCGEDIQNILRSQIKKFEKSFFFSFTKKSKTSNYGVIEFDKEKKPIQIVEKPKNFISNQILCGLFCFDHNVLNHSLSLKKSIRGETEISDLINIYIKNKNITHFPINNRNNYWIDMGEVSNIKKAAQLSMKMNTLKNSYGYLDVDAYLNGFIDLKLFNRSLKEYPNNNTYKKNIERILN